MSKLPTAVVTPEFTASYLHVLQPAETPSGAMKYSVAMVFPKGTDLTEMKTAATNAAVNKWGDKVPKNIRSPFREGNDKENPDDLYKDAIFVNASANEDRKPGLVDSTLKPIIDPSEVYSGMICRAQVNFFAYDTAGNQGIGVGFNHLMKVRDSERLSGTTAEQAFAGFAEAPSNDQLAF